MFFSTKGGVFLQKNKEIIKYLPNFCTLLNTMCGILALMISVFYKSFLAINCACFFILLGGIFDALDGRLARKLNATSAMGKELDSFADLITFGITPMCVFMSLHSVVNSNLVTMPEIVISTCYISCAVFRLARYNVSDCTESFEGLPSTASGMFMSLYIFISNFTHHLWQGQLAYTIFSYGLIVFLGLAMISTVKVRRI